MQASLSASVPTPTPTPYQDPDSDPSSLSSSPAPTPTPPIPSLNPTPALPFATATTTMILSPTLASNLTLSLQTGVRLAQALAKDRAETMPVSFKLISAQWLSSANQTALVFDIICNDKNGVSNGVLATDMYALLALQLSLFEDMYPSSPSPHLASSLPPAFPVFNEQVNPSDKALWSFLQPASLTQLCRGEYTSQCVFHPTTLLLERKLRGRTPLTQTTVKITTISAVATSLVICLSIVVGWQKRLSRSRL